MANKNRLYWANFKFDIPADRNITFDDINDHSQDWLSNDYINNVSKWKAQQDPIKNATYIGTNSKLLELAIEKEQDVSETVGQLR